MATGGEPGHLHSVRTTRNRYAYFFDDKHHGRGGPRAAQWAEDVSEEEEFAIFDRSDDLDLSDTDGNLYGLRIGPNGEILVLGTWKQQVAEFPRAHPGHPWHGYPLGPLKDTRPPHPPVRPLPRDALQKMVDRGLLSGGQRKRLLLGRTTQGEVFACAARDDGLVAFTLDSGAERIRMSSRRFVDRDIIDVCSLNTPELPYAVAGLDADGTLVVCRDLLKEPLRIVGLLNLDGTAYNMLRLHDHLVFLTSKTLAIAPNLVQRLLNGPSVNDKMIVRKTRIEDAIQVSSAFDRLLLVVTDTGLTMMEIDQFLTDQETESVAWTPTSLELPSGSPIASEFLVTGVP
jgi:hypothetical protein